MPLDNLLGLIANPQERIRQHSTPLRQSEMLTRYALIDPLLRGLGWDTDDPDQVRPEYHSGSGSSDYALLSQGTPFIMIEAKRLDTLLQPALAQGINYCLMEGTPYFVVTDGRVWEIYETHRQAPIAQKLVVSFDISNQSPAGTALKALALWRPAVASGTVVLPQAPIVQAITPADHDAVPLPPPASDQPSAVHDPAPASPPPPVTPNDGWIALSRLQPRKFDGAPQSLKLPDGTTRPLGRWINLAVEMVRWLSDKGLLTPQRCPVRRASRYLVSLSPVHPDGKAFTHPRQAGNLYLEGNYNGPSQHENALIILNHLGQDPEQFSVRFR